MTYLTTLESTPTETKRYESLVSMFATQARGKGESITSPVSLRMAFYFGIPPSRAKKLKEGDAHFQRPDIDNCIKSILDGMNRGIIFRDDSLVTKIEAAKYWSKTPRAEVEVETVE